MRAVHAQCKDSPWVSEAPTRHHCAPVPVHERQSVGRVELRGVFWVLQGRQAGEHLVVVSDSEYVYKRIVATSGKWRPGRWDIETCGRP